MGGDQHTCEVCVRERGFVAMRQTWVEALRNIDTHYVRIGFVEISGHALASIGHIIEGMDVTAQPDVRLPRATAADQTDR